MEFIGFSEETTKWFKSYLSNRKFIVHIKNNSQSLVTSYVELIKDPFNPFFCYIQMNCRKLLTENYCYMR